MQRVDLQSCDWKLPRNQRLSIRTTKEKSEDNWKNKSIADGNGIQHTITHRRTSVTKSSFCSLVETNDTTVAKAQAAQIKVKKKQHRAPDKAPSPWENKSLPFPFPPAPVLLVRDEPEPEPEPDSYKS